MPRRGASRRQRKRGRRRRQSTSRAATRWPSEDDGRQVAAFDGMERLRGRALSERRLHVRVADPCSGGGGGHRKAARTAVITKK